MSTTSVPHTGPRTGRRRDPLVPPQHGAWAFLGLPVALGTTAAAWSPVWPVVAAAWVAAYPLSWAVSGLIGGPRRERFARPAILWGSLFVPLALVSLWLRPWLWVAAVVYAALFAVNLAFARARRERALANDLVLVAECSLAVPVVVGVAVSDSGSGSSAWPPWEAMLTGHVAVLVLVCALTLVGSTLHVKSLIRERSDARYAVASQVFALACVPVVALALAWWQRDLGFWLVVPFVVLSERARLVPGRAWRPGRIGLVELACFVLVALAAAVAA